MDCKATRNALHLYVDGELDARARADVEDHLRQCTHCADELAALRRLALRTYDAFPERQAPAEMDGAILRAIAAAPAGKARRMTVRNNPVGPRPLSLHQFFEDVARAFGIVGEWLRDHDRWKL